MANRPEREGEGEETGGEGMRTFSSYGQKLNAKELAPEDLTNIAPQFPSQPQSVAQSRRVDQAGIQPQKSPFELGYMSAALPDVSPTNYQGNNALRPSQVNSSEGLPLRHREYPHTTVFPTPPGPGVPAPQYSGQPYQQGRHTARFQPSYPGGLTTYSHPQSFGHPYPQQVSQIQGHPAAYSHAGTGYYPIQQQYLQSICAQPPYQL